MDWIPTKATAKGRLVLAALEAFGEHGYEAVKVGELAAAAETTTGPLYHHFGSKAGLYAFVREDVDRRVAERMEGALAAALDFETDAVGAALLVAYDYARRAGFMRMLSEPREPDPIAATLNEAVGAPLGAMLAAAWRAALAAGGDPEEARAALRALRPAGALHAPPRSPART
ncbi:TetR/AcrR family transcriptional regulator [Solirubrobacter sp. CPCC 204708]|uniref:TetR/AcrR family transcriptional regulator n=1 Tax=Solirubrobacter deserti TaxID=2282478 RepID=A0ABT4RE47_9ACTN|nr:TetR/AcrR family transcriptional regulator [Solirubrobacter deserti]MBE2314634.1 TetR/AcrR family transcriptional regulator [Solirubrobacter deserti]MDA0136641.1 TetR/AcrR family transcriptional regulator [Solirubrobacter deserti]